MAFVQAIVLVRQRAGAAPEALLQQAQITPLEVENPGGPRDRLAVRTPFGLAMQALDDEALGWFSRRPPWGSMGCWHALHQRPHPWASHSSAGAWHHGLLQEDITLRLDSTGGLATLSLTHPPRPGAAARVLPGVEAAQCPWAGLLADRFAHPAGLRSFRWHARRTMAPMRCCSRDRCALTRGPLRSRSMRALPGLPLQRDETALRLMLRARCC